MSSLLPAWEIVIFLQISCARGLSGRVVPRGKPEDFLNLLSPRYRKEKLQSRRMRFSSWSRAGFTHSFLVLLTNPTSVRWHEGGGRRSRLQKDPCRTCEDFGLHSKQTDFLALWLDHL